MGALRPGQLLDGTSYQVVREIGAGGMGVVYEIEHVRLKKRYVAKVIHDQIKNDDGAAKRMEREAQVLAAISHPNIVQVHDVGTTQDGVSYFVMEKLEGVDLRSMMKQGVTWIRSIEIVIDVLDALEYVHRRGIVHRDIKPENIFLSEQPRGTVTKVLDFGIVHIFDKDGRVSQGRITKTGGFVGTLYYAAPEQMQGKPASPPNDVYAAGLVLFELLAGKGPFDDDPGVGLSRCFKAAPLLSEIVSQAPRELSEAVAKALEQDPERRPAAGALATELRAVVAALKSIPAVVEDEAIRAEVHDLLRHMAPVDDAPPRPAAGRMVTPGREVAAGRMVTPGREPAAALASTAGADIASGATAVPQTPVMAGAPARGPSDPRAVFEPTLASATGEPPPSPGMHSPKTAASAGVQPLPPERAHEQAPIATMLGAGVAPTRQSTPDAPAHAAPRAIGAPATGAAAWSAPMIGSPAMGAAGGGPLAGAVPPGTAAHGPAALVAPQRISSPGVPGDGGPNAHGHSLSAPPPSPRFPPGTERGVGPAQASSGHVHPSQPGNVHTSQPGPPPALFAATLPVRPVRAESTPGAPARHGDTSPGVYATVDNQPTSTPLPKRAPWTAITLAAGALVLTALLIGGALALRQKTGSTSAASPSTETTVGAATASGTTTATNTGANAATTPAPTTAAPAATAANEATSRPDATTSNVVATTAASPNAPTKPTAAGAAHVAPTTPAARPTPTSTQPAKPAAPAAPRAASSGRAAERDGYINSF